MRGLSLCVWPINFVSISGCLLQYLQLTNWAAFSLPYSTATDLHVTCGLQQGGRPRHCTDLKSCAHCCARHAWYAVQCTNPCSLPTCDLMGRDWWWNPTQDRLSHTQEQREGGCFLQNPGWFQAGNTSDFEIAFARFKNTFQLLALGENVNTHHFSTHALIAKAGDLQWGWKSAAAHSSHNCQQTSPQTTVPGAQHRALPWYQDHFYLNLSQQAK